MESTNNINKFVISSINVNSLSIFAKLKSITKHVNDLNNFGFVLTDTRSSEASELQIRRLMPNYELFFNHGTSNSKGTITLINRKSQCKTVDFKIIVPGQLAHLDLLINCRPYRIVAVYGPSNKDDPTFFSDSLFNETVIQHSTATIICGDFNAVQKRSLDTLNYISNNRENSTKAINTGKLEYILVDPFRSKYPKTLDYTWRTWAIKTSTKVKKARLDYFLISEHLLKYVKRVCHTRVDSFVTDHNQIDLEINFDNHKQGPGTWKFPNELLYDPAWSNLQIKPLRNTFCFIEVKLAL